MKKGPPSKKVKPYVKISLNVPDDMLEELEEVSDVLGADRTRLILRALESCMDQFKREADAVRKVRGDEPRTKGKG